MRRDLYCKKGLSTFQHTPCTQLGTSRSALSREHHPESTQTAKLPIKNKLHTIASSLAACAALGEMLGFSTFSCSVVRDFIGVLCVYVFHSSQIQIATRRRGVGCDRANLDERNKHVYMCICACVCFFICMDRMKVLTTLYIQASWAKASTRLCRLEMSRAPSLECHIDKGESIKRANHPTGHILWSLLSLVTGPLLLRSAVGGPSRPTTLIMT